MISLAVNDALTSGALPTDTNAVYFVLTSSEIAESSGFCSQVSGWERGRCGLPGPAMPAARRLSWPRLLSNRGVWLVPANAAASPLVATALENIAIFHYLLH